MSEQNESGKELVELFSVIQERKNTMPSGSYTTSLYEAGLDKMSLKIAEEALEVVHAAQKQSDQRLVEESVDLVYHLFVLLSSKGIDISSLEEEVRKRRK